MPQLLSQDLMRMNRYEKIAFSLTKLKVKLSLPLDQDDCYLIQRNYLATHARHLNPGPQSRREFRSDLKKFRIYIRKDSSDVAVIYQVIIKNQYGVLTDLIRKNYPGRVKCIIDAGANIGLATLHLKRNFPEAGIVSLEPDEGNYNLFVKNIKANHLADITPLKAGLWHARKFLRVVRDTGDGREWSFSVEESAGQDKDTVQGYGIPDLLQMKGWDVVDVLKIDIEGAERFLFSDPASVQAFLSRTRFLAMEIHDQFVSRAGIYEQLKANHFEYFDSGELTIAVNRNLVQ